MPDLEQLAVTPRRGFFGRIAALSALGLFGFAPTAARTVPIGRGR